MGPSSLSRAGDSFNGDARLCASGFGKGAVVLDRPKIMLRIGMSSRGSSIHSCKGRIGCKPKVPPDADTYFLRFNMGQVQNAHHGIEELKMCKMKTHASEFVDIRIMPRFPTKQTWILLYRLLQRQRCWVRASYCALATQPKMPCSAT